MRTYTTYILAVFILATSSCATLFNSKTRRIDITTSEPVKLVLNNETIITANNQATVYIPRNNKVLKFTATNDSVHKTTNVNPQNSLAYYLNATMPLLWGGFLIDDKKPKRYTYPDEIYINMSGSNPAEYIAPEKKGQIFLKLSLPWINNFSLKPENENYKVNTGFMGFAAGMDLYHSQKQFLNVTVGSAVDFVVPFPAPIRYEGVHTQMYSSYIAVSNNHKLNKISLGYGLSFANNVWNNNYSGSRADTLIFDKRPRKNSYNTLGFMFPIHYQIKKYLYAGIIYRPTIYRFTNSEKFAYEHLISIDLGWRIRLKR